MEGTERVLAADLICLAVGLRPMAELARMAGACFRWIPELGGYVPLHDATMQTTVPGLYVAGDVSGVEEASTAMEEGKLAGLSVARSLGKLPREEYAALAEEVGDNLAELRLGSFGDERKRCKDEIVARYRNAYGGAEVTHGQS